MPAFRTCRGPGGVRPGRGRGSGSRDDGAARRGAARRGAAQASGTAGGAEWATHLLERVEACRCDVCAASAVPYEPCRTGAQAVQRRAQRRRRGRSRAICPVRLGARLKSVCTAGERKVSVSQDENPLACCVLRDRPAGPAAAHAPAAAGAAAASQRALPVPVFHAERRTKALSIATHRDLLLDLLRADLEKDCAPTFGGCTIASTAGRGGAIQGEHEV